MSLRQSKEKSSRGMTRAPVRLAETAQDAAKGIDWGVILVVFMRLLAVLWVAQGLTQWTAILLPSTLFLEAVTLPWATAVIFFAIFDLVAAVGLWLASPWGGAIWLFVALAQIFVAVVIPGFFSMAWISANIVLIGLYFFLTWQAGHAITKA
jgi:uncharacterized membrane protein (DUF2068 family)